jgi:hypothetical protein
MFSDMQRTPNEHTNPIQSFDSSLYASAGFQLSDFDYLRGRYSMYNLDKGTLTSEPRRMHWNEGRDGECMQDQQP